MPDSDRILRAGEGRYAGGPDFGIRFMLSGDRTGGGFSMVEHPIGPRVLAAPLHRHRYEDEWSFVLEGEVGCQLGDDVVVAGADDVVFKRRDEWHTFWNAGDRPARILEIISPAGFEGYFATQADLLDAGHTPGPGVMEALLERYGLEFDLESIPGLLERHGLVLPTPPEA